ncbi:MAG: DUF3791 domain-containing protein [Clostridia bacterium]|nr:DUF3791 domain-containing protein [Clostridia bacterium]
MSKEMPFLILCIEEYKLHKGLSGAETMALFNKFDVCRYIIELYECLHTCGMEYIMEDIDSFIACQS